MGGNRMHWAGQSQGGRHAFCDGDRLHQLTSYAETLGWAGYLRWLLRSSVRRSTAEAALTEAARQESKEIGRRIQIFCRQKARLPQPASTDGEEQTPAYAPFIGQKKPRGARTNA